MKFLKQSKEEGGYSIERILIGNDDWRGLNDECFVRGRTGFVYILPPALDEVDGKREF